MGVEHFNVDRYQIGIQMEIKQILRSKIQSKNEKEFPRLFFVVVAGSDLWSHPLIKQSIKIISIVLKIDTTKKKKSLWEPLYCQRRKKKSKQNFAYIVVAICE